jgi:drug/metabolite transporter (DMT)-like permease
MTPRSPAFVAALCATLAVLFFSVNDTAIKFLSGSYALHEVVLIRSAIGLCVILCVIAPLTDGWKIARTRRLKMHLVRGLCVVVANMTFFLGLAAMPLAEAVAIFFVSPLVISVFSIIFLGEHVGPRRWFAIAVGLVGVVVVLRPGTLSFQYASLLPLASAVAYAGLHMLTRKIGVTDSAATMAFYIQITFILVCLLVGAAIGDGRFGNQSDPSLAFLFRAWTWPATSDLPILFAVGVGIALGGYFISQAYRVAEAGYVAPFEYLAVPLSIFWGVLVFDEVPDAMTLLGASLIVGSGLFTVWRESQIGRTTIAGPTRR